MDHVALDFLPGGTQVDVRELSGHEEQMVTGTGTVMAIRLLDRLLTARNGDGASGVDSSQMTAADRDKLLAVVYMRTYGPNIESTVRCCKCGVLFDLDFSLKDLQASLADGAKRTSAAHEPEGTFLLSNGCRFRLPTGEDECAVLGMPSEDAGAALVRRCIVGEDTAADHEDVEASMAEVAPMLDVDLSARCPECDHEQSVHFDIQSFVLTTLQQEQGRLAWEVHRLACAYGWRLEEILGLPRSLRRTYVALVESEFPSRRRFSV